MAVTCMFILKAIHTLHISLFLTEITYSLIHSVVLSHNEFSFLKKIIGEYYKDGQLLTRGESESDLLPLYCFYNNVTIDC